MVTREFPPNSGGIGYYVYYLSKTLIERGHKVFVITRGDSLQTKVESFNGIKVFKVSYIPLYPFHIWIHGFYVNRLLKSLEHELNVVHLHSPLPPVIDTSLPVITTFHSPCKRAFHKEYRDTKDLSSLAEQLQTMVLYPLIESKIIKRSNKITTVSSNVSEELRAYGLNPKKITVVGNAVDTNFFAPNNSNRLTKPYVLFVGILRSGKGILDLIDIAKNVCNQRPDVRFVVAGIGPLFKNLYLKAQRMGLQKKIIFLKYVDRENLVKLYQNSAVLVQPSAHEGLSTVVLEAMSCGLPVVAYDIPGNRQVISSGANGILVSPKSFKSMADSILKLLNDQKLKENIERAARITIENNFSWDRVADRMIDCYNELQTIKKSFKHCESF